MEFQAYQQQPTSVLFFLFFFILCERKDWLVLSTT